MPQLTANNLIVLRHLSSGDQAVFEAYRRDPKVAKYQSWDEMSSEKTAQFLLHMSALDPILQPGHWSQIAVALEKTDTLIGDMGWYLSKDLQTVELGITLARNHQRKGYARAAMRLAMNYVFSNFPVQQIICGADTRNTPSLEMVRKLGFVWTHQEPSPSEPGLLDDMFVMTRGAFSEN